MKTKRAWIGLAFLLCGCPIGWSDGRSPPPGKGGQATDTFLLTPGRDGTATFVVRWSSGKGRQNVRALHHQVPDDGRFRRMITLTLPGGKRLVNMERDGVDYVIEGLVTCESSRCDMEAVGNVTIEYLAEPSSIEDNVEAVEVAWNVALVISPKDSDVEVSDLVVEVLAQDAGAP